MSCVGSVFELEDEEIFGLKALQTVFPDWKKLWCDWNRHTAENMFVCRW